MPYDFHADAILDPAYRYWQSKCGERPMPSRRDIDPAEIPQLLPHIQITELVGERIRYRLAGTAIVKAYGGELKGKFFDEVFAGDRLRFVVDNYRSMRAARRPILVSNQYFTKRGAPLRSNRMVMPLSEDGAAVNQCFTAMSFEFPGNAEEWTGRWFGTDGDFDFVQSRCEVVR